MWFPIGSDTNRAVQCQKQTRSLKFWIYKVEELYYPCSENKGADRLCRLLVFPCGGSIMCSYYVAVSLDDNELFQKISFLLIS